MYSITFLWHVSWLKRHLSRRRKRHPSRCLAGPLAGQSADPKRHQLHWVLGQWKTRQKHRELARPKPLSCSSFYTSKLYHRTVGPVDFHRSRFSIWEQLHLKFLNFPDYLLQALSPYSKPFPLNFSFQVSKYLTALLISDLKYCMSWWESINRFNFVHWFTPKLKNLNRLIKNRSPICDNPNEFQQKHFFTV